MKFLWVCRRAARQDRPSEPTGLPGGLLGGRAGRWRPEPPRPRRSSSSCRELARCKPCAVLAAARPRARANDVRPFFPVLHSILSATLSATRGQGPKGVRTIILSEFYSLRWPHGDMRQWGLQSALMTNEQLYVAIGIPVLFNAAMMGLLIAYMNARFTSSERSINQRFDAIDKRFDDMRDLWRAELHRVEEVLDARLKHLEQRQQAPEGPFPPLTL